MIEATYIFDKEQLADRIRSAMAAFGVPEPLTLEEWAREHFYLSAESSYVEQRWTPWPFQRAILAAISNDDIREIDVKKSARVGYTKTILAAQGYFAEHKRRNQAIWQPTDDDATEYVKTELDPMLRDVPIMRRVLPSVSSRHADNTLQLKRFIGSMLHIKGAKAAKNFRRISIDVGYIDELDACDRDIEKEGDAPSLVLKRVEGATFPKFICGSTPKLRGFSLIEERERLAKHRLSYRIPCPHCGEYHALTWGGKDIDHGFKWTGTDPDTVRHLCPHCAALITQADYLAVWEKGKWTNEDDTLHILADGRFVTADGSAAEPPTHIAFTNLWTAYSPSATWSDIVREFLSAREKMEQGDNAKMKAWTNTTLGQSWEEEIERTDADELKQRAEPFALGTLPRDCLLLLCGGDTQDNRIEIGVWGYGRGGQMWSIDHRVFYGNPGQPDIWLDLEEFLFGAEYPHACGTAQKIYATAIDSGGHYTNDVYAFAHAHSRNVFAVRGSPGRERGIENGNSKVDYRKNGKTEKNGTTLWHVGTNLAKDRLQSRLEVAAPGPGYVHFSRDLSDEWFRQLAGEDRVARRTQFGTETRWTPNRKRVEVKDCVTYAIWLEEHLNLWSKKKRTWWDELETRVQPAIQDLFAAPLAAQLPPRPTPAAPLAAPHPLPPRATSARALASSEWSRRL